MDSEQEQVEELKKWWKENGRMVVIGLVLGLGGVLGWTSWRSHTQSQAEAASQMYSQLVNTASEGTFDQARRQADELIEKFPSSGYAALGSLVAARAAYEEKDPEAAKRYLQRVVEEGEGIEVRDIARARLARILLAEGKPDEALRALDAVEGDSFAGISGEIRGDVLRAKDETQAAVQAYRGVLDAAEVAAETRRRVQMKLDNLGAGDAQASAQ